MGTEKERECEKATYIKQQQHLDHLKKSKSDLLIAKYPKISGLINLGNTCYL